MQMIPELSFWLTDYATTHTHTHISACFAVTVLQHSIDGQDILEAVNDGGAKEGVPLHGDAIQNGPGKVCIEVDLSRGIRLVHPIPGWPHCGLHKGVWSQRLALTWQRVVKQGSLESDAGFYGLLHSQLCILIVFTLFLRRLSNITLLCWQFSFSSKRWFSI